jgi:hypothetical protein
MLPADHVDIAATDNNIGVCLHFMNRIPEAIQFYKEAQKILTSKLGPNHPRTLIVNKNLNIAQRKNLRNINLEFINPQATRATETKPSKYSSNLKQEAKKKNRK